MNTQIETLLKLLNSLDSKFNPITDNTTYKYIPDCIQPHQVVNLLEFLQKQLIKNIEASIDKLVEARQAEIDSWCKENQESKFIELHNHINAVYEKYSNAIIFRRVLSNYIKPLDKTQGKPCEYGDLMSLKEFISNVKSGGFIDYDGHGYYAFRRNDEYIKTDISICPSHVSYELFRTDCGFVYWYNK